MAGLIIRKRKVVAATPYSFTEPFNTNGLLDAYATWYSEQVNGIDLTVSSGTVQTTTATTDGARGAYGTHVTKPNTFDNYVEAKIAVRAPTALDTGIWLHAIYGARPNMPNNRLVALVITNNSTTNGIYTFQSDAAGTHTATKRATLGVAPALNTIVRLEAKKNASGNYVYTAYTGGVSRVSWEDTGKVAFPTSDICYGGLYSAFQRQLFSNTLSNGWDDFKFGDITA